MRQRLMVALFTDSFDHIDGVSNTFKRLVAYCCERQESLDIFTYGQTDQAVENIGPVRIFRYRPLLPVPYYTNMAWDLATPRRAIVCQISRGNYDLVHLATPGSMGLNGLYAAFRAGLPLIGSYHTALPEYARPRVESLAQKLGLPTEPLGSPCEQFVWRYVEWFYGCCRIVLAPSQFTRSNLEARLKSPVRIFSRGVDSDRFHPCFRQKRDRVTLLYVGRISIEKGLDRLVRALKDRNDVDIVVAGDGPYRSEMQQQLRNATFPGFVTGEALSKTYASADVFVFPSTTDTFGNVVLEAMSSGLPVIVTDQMGPQELVKDGVNGFVVADDRTLGQRLDLLIRDEVVRKTMGRKARESALARNWHSVFEDLFLNYQLALSHPTPLQAESLTVAVSR